MGVRTLIVNIISTLLLVFVGNIVIYTSSEDGSKLEKNCKIIHAMLLITIFITSLIHIWTR